MDVVPYFRYISALILFGLSFYFLNLSYILFTDYITSESSYFQVLSLLWTVLPAVVLLGTGLRLVMVSQKRSS